MPLEIIQLSYYLIYIQYACFLPMGLLLMTSRPCMEECLLNIQRKAVVMSKTAIFSNYSVLFTNTMFDVIFHNVILPSISSKYTGNCVYNTCIITIVKYTYFIFTAQYRPFGIKIFSSLFRHIRANHRRIMSSFVHLGKVIKMSYGCNL